MVSEHLRRLVERARADPSFAERTRADLEGLLAAEGIALSPEEVAAVRAAQAEGAGLASAEVGARLEDARRRTAAGE